MPIADEPDKQRFSIYIPARLQKAIDAVSENRSEYIAQAITDKLIADGHMPASEEDAELFDLFRGLLEKAHSNPELSDRLKEVFEAIASEDHTLMQCVKNGIPND